MLTLLYYITKYVIIYKNREDDMKSRDKEILLGTVPFLLIIAFMAISLSLHFGAKKKPEAIELRFDSFYDDSFFKDEEKDGERIITISDKTYSVYSDSHYTSNPGKIQLLVDGMKNSDLDWSIEIVDNKQTRTIERDNLPAGTEIHLFADSFALDYGENKITATAKNSKGSTELKFKIIKLSTEEECAKAENSEKQTCKNIADANKADAKKKAEKEEEQKKNVNNNFSGSSSIVKNGCLHYSYGKCWDELEDRAYEDGYRDGMNGNGHSYYDPGCTGICEDIYEDAYEEGNYDGKYGL